ncbi:MAG TPA: hypothetical protein VJR89_41410 [Polyangiales bacterium]|nr:hypothetical protein [Polyangiales bacterium]
MARHWTQLLFGLGLLCVALPAFAQPTAETAPQPAAAEPAVELEPEPVQDVDQAPPKSKRQCSTQDVLSGVCTQEEAALAAAEKPWRLMARAELELPVIWDDSPENELLAHY